MHDGLVSSMARYPLISSGIASCTFLACLFTVRNVDIYGATHFLRKHLPLGPLSSCVFLKILRLDQVKQVDVISLLRSIESTCSLSSMSCAVLTAFVGY